MSILQKQSLIFVSLSLIIHSSHLISSHLSLRELLPSLDGLSINLTYIALDFKVGQGSHELIEFSCG